jgi:RHS repeat-associated protein
LTAKVPYNLRFPGQYYQAETGLNQNWNRDYDPIVGRYVESDPIGLAGGIDPYAYVGSEPVSLVDPQGLDAIQINYD